MPSLLFAAVLAALPFTVGAQRPPTGIIEGRVAVARPKMASLRRPAVSELGGPSRPVTAEPPRSVVYLESAPLGAFQRTGRAARVSMDQQNETFVPHVLAITVGTEVAFPNSDHIYHNVFSLSRPARFDLGRYAAGHSKSVRFDRPGIVRVFCDIHSHMNAFILVFSHPFFAVTDARGRYQIENVPPGTYSVVAWNEGTATEPRPVVVGGDAAEVDFAIP